jgi:hypothetical protein
MSSSQAGSGSRIVEHAEVQFSFSALLHTSIKPTRTRYTATQLLFVSSLACHNDTNDTLCSLYSRGGKGCLLKSCSLHSLRLSRSIYIPVTICTLSNGPDDDPRTLCPPLHMCKYLAVDIFLRTLSHLPRGYSLPAPESTTTPS